MSALSHIIFAGYDDKETRRNVIKNIHDSLLENIEVMEQKGNLKKNYEDGVVRKKFIF